MKTLNFKTLTFKLFGPLGLAGMATAFAAEQSAPEKWPPPMTGARNGVATVKSTEFLAVPTSVQKAREAEGAATFVVAKTPPVVEIAYHGDLPNRALNGTGWSAWGDILVASDGTVYSATGNHGNNALRPGSGGGEAFVYRWNPLSKTLSKIADLNKIAGGGDGDPSWSKVHAGIHESAGFIYFTGTLNDGGRSFQTPWTKTVSGGQLFRYDPKSGEIKVALSFPGESTPTTILDRDRHIWYANFEGKTSKTDVALTAVDLLSGKIVFQSPHDAVSGSRNLAIARDGSVFFNGKGGLWKFDPRAKTIADTRSSFPDNSSMRASTEETRAGYIYGATMRPARIFRLAPAKDELEMLGPDFLAGNYTTVVVLSPDEKYLYYLPGAHGGAAQIGTPVVQWNIATNERKVLAFLKSPKEKATGYSPAGTYGAKMSADGATLYVNFNGSLAQEANPPKRQAKNFGLTAFAAIHIPASER